MNSLTLSVTSALPQNQTRKRVTKKNHSVGFPQRRVGAIGKKGT